MYRQRFFNRPTSYSSAHRRFNPILPSNARGGHYDNPNGELAISRLEQANVLDVIRNNPRDKLLGPYITPIASTLHSTHQAVGAVCDESGQVLSSCFLIADNLMVVARHVIEGSDIRAFDAVFNYHNSGNGPVASGRYNFVNVVEEDAGLDYAVVQLSDSPGKQYGHLKLATLSMANFQETVLLHHPLGKPLKVSVHGLDAIANLGSYREVFHDSDLCSSGAPYLIANGSCVALHLGIEVKESHFIFNLKRYALEIQTIVNQKPNGIIASLALGRCSPKRSYQSDVSCFELNPVARDFLEIEMRDQRARREAQKQRARSLAAAANGAALRLNEYGSNWATMSVRQLAAAFPQRLGTKALGRKEYTDSNKVCFKNTETGWYICHDIAGNYNTICRDVLQMEAGGQYKRDKDGRVKIAHEYLRLDGTIGDGKGPEFHFHEGTELKHSSVRMRSAS